MDRTIKDLKDENQLLRDGIRTITAALNSGEYGSMASIDSDLAGLHASFGHLVAEHGHAVRRADEAVDNVEWLKSEWVKCWDNGYLNGREDTLTQVARDSRVLALSADHDAALLRSECGVVTSKFAGEDMISAKHVRELFFDRADAIARGDSEWCPAGHGDELGIDKADRRGDT